MGDDVTDDGSDDGSDDTKRELRRRLLAERRGLAAAEVAAASRAVVATLRTLPELVPGGRPLGVLLHAADPDEVALDELLAAPPDGWRVLLPRVAGDRIEVVAHPPGAELVPGAFGVREPVGPALDLGTVDVVVAPGVAFTPRGDRLGRGGGFYDRLLATCGTVRTVGVCMERFVVDTLPLEPHDVAVDVLVTDAPVRRRSAPAGDGPT